MRLGAMRLPAARRLTDIPHLTALRHRDYRNTWSANMCSGAAMWTFIAAISWLVLDKSDSSGWVGIVAFGSMIPFLVVSPVSGVLADVMDRRRVALAMFVAGALSVGLMAGLALADRVELWQVAVLAFVTGVFRATQEPAIQALIPNQVPREDLLNAITLNSATRHGARLALLIAAPLMAVDFIGVPGVLVLSTALQVLGAVLMGRTRTVSSGRMDPEHGLIRNFMDGLVHIYSHRVLTLFFVLVFLHCGLTMSFESILPVFSRDELGASDGSIFGYVVMGFGVGSLAGILALAGVRDERRKGQLLVWTGIASGVTPMLLAVSGSVPLAVLAGAGMGASQATFMALTLTYVQAVVPDRLRGRIASLYTLHAGGIMAFTNLGFGFAADAFSAPPILLATGLLFVMALIGLSAGQRRLRDVYRTGRVATVTT